MKNGVHCQVHHLLHICVGEERVPHLDILFCRRREKCSNQEFEPDLGFFGSKSQQCKAESCKQSCLVHIGYILVCNSSQIICRGDCVGHCDLHVLEVLLIHSLK